MCFAGGDAGRLLVETYLNANFNGVPHLPRDLKAPRAHVEALTLSRAEFEPKPASNLAASFGLVQC
jgi:hypothetical protein